MALPILLLTVIVLLTVRQFKISTLLTPMLLMPLNKMGIIILDLSEGSMGEQVIC